MPRAPRRCAHLGAPSKHVFPDRDWRRAETSRLNLQSCSKIIANPSPRSTSTDRVSFSNSKSKQLSTKAKQHCVAGEQFNLSRQLRRMRIAERPASSPSWARTSLAPLRGQNAMNHCGNASDYVGRRVQLTRRKIVRRREEREAETSTNTRSAAK